MPPTLTQQARLDILERLVSSPAFRSEATIQSDVRMLLLDPELGLAEEQLEVELETQVGQRRRIDIERGRLDHGRIQRC